MLDPSRTEALSSAGYGGQRARSGGGTGGDGLAREHDQSGAGGDRGASGGAPMAHLDIEEATFMAVTRSYLSGLGLGSGNAFLHGGSGHYRSSDGESDGASEDENDENHYGNDYPDELSSSGGEHGDDEDSSAY